MILTTHDYMIDLLLHFTFKYIKQEDNVMLC